VKVLITGGMGVIGAETSRKFVKEGHRPVIFARHRDDSLIADIVDKVDFEQGDVLDMPRILQAIKKHQVTHVVHAAAFVGAVRLHRQVTLVLQAHDHFIGAGRFHLTVEAFAGRGQRLVAEQRHVLSLPA